MIADTHPASGFQLGHGGKGILLLHGFCGSAAQMRYLAEGLHKCGYTVSVPLLLAEQFPADALITLSAPMHLTGLRGLLAPFSPLASLMIPYLKFPGQRKYPDDFLHEHHIGCETLPVAKVNDLYVLMRRARRNLFAVTAPLMVIQSSDDTTTSASSPKIILTGVSSPIRRRIHLTHSGHLISLGPERNIVLESMADFLDECACGTELGQKYQ